MRISEGVDGPVTTTALALSSGETAAEAVVFVSCDLGSFRHHWYDENDFLVLVREAIAERDATVPVEQVILNATHTHTAPNSLNGRFGDAAPEGVMTADEYMEFVRVRIAEAVVEAWQKRRNGGVGFGLGTAVVGHNRRATFSVADSTRKGGAVIGGLTKMYGKTNDPNFTHIEGYEDHYVDLLYTFDDAGNVTGVVVNFACPSQETEMGMKVSADFWHEIREEVQRRLGSHVHVLGQCAAAGDQSSHRLWYKEAEQRMLELRGVTMRQEIGRRVADTVAEVLPAVAKDIRSDLRLSHMVRTIQIPRWLVTDEEAAQAKEDLAKLEADAASGVNNYRLIRPCRRVLERYESQKQSSTLPMDLHAVRIGDVGFVTNRFELFLDFGIRIKARSPAIQTFVVQLAANVGWTGNYLPSERAAANKGYGGSVYNAEVGPEGGQTIVEESITALNELWKSC